MGLPNPLQGLPERADSQGLVWLEEVQENMGCGCSIGYGEGAR